MNKKNSISMRTISEKKIQNFQTKLFEWYKNNKRDFPWRKTTNPYYIHISEMMLQQTQAQRVIPYYQKFIKTYPTLQDLAKANKKDLLILWQGLGYNTRVLRLQHACQEIIKHHNSTYPTSQTSLLTLPGIGPYTAGAICAFAYNLDVAVVDTNIRRILIGEFDLHETLSEKQLQEIALQILPKGQSREWYNALMDYGALEFTAKKTKISSLSKQGTFKGSTREARSKLLKYLLEHNQIKNSKAQELVQPHILEEIAKKMEKEGLVICEKNHIYLKE
jgi:A/G-specific adenine glycosylase